MEGVSSGGNSTMVYFSCEDCAVEAGRVEAAGGRVEKEKFSIGEYGFIAIVFDTEGNMIGLHSQQEGLNSTFLELYWRWFLPEIPRAGSQFAE